jgi:glycosyltransferase involved in cell wall biosynthesis
MELVKNKKRKVAIVVSDPMIAKFFLLPHINKLSKRYLVTLICNMEYQSDYLESLHEDISLIHIGICREIEPIKDIQALIRLLYHLKIAHYDFLYSITPKAGLLAMISSKVSNVPYRVHTFTGQVWVNSSGVKKYILMNMDRIIAILASYILIDSPSQRDFLINKNIVGSEKSNVLGVGSITGIDVNRFKQNLNERKFNRKKLKIDDSMIIVLFLGRLKREKGVFELIRAFKNLSKRMKNLKLIIAGPDEENIQPALELELMSRKSDVYFYPYVKKPEELFNIADIFCLPSFREGFGNVIIEAAAYGIPSIASRIYGLTDAIVDQETGILVKAGSIDELEKAIFYLANNVQERNRLGSNARIRVNQEFKESELTEKFSDFVDGYLD